MTLKKGRRELFFVLSEIQFSNEPTQVPQKNMIIETPDISDILKHMSSSGEESENQILLIFDLDETVMRVLEHEATGEWFSNEQTRLMQLGKSADDAKKFLLPVHITAYHKTAVEIMDTSIYEIFKILRTHNTKIMALTAREGHALAEPTFRQLRDINLAFAENNDDAWQNTLLFPEIPDKDALFSQGILFTGGTDKGTILNLFLQKIKYFPSKIIFIDDSLKNVQSVQSFAQNNDLAFVGLHYTKAQYISTLTGKVSQNHTKAGIS